MIHPLVQRFTDLVDSWNYAGIGEHVLWEVLEGLRKQPFPFLPPLSDEEFEMCRRIRDELKVWPFFYEGKWMTVSLAFWQAQRLLHDSDQLNLEAQAQYWHARARTP
jgi:hypothetical protein